MTDARFDLATLGGHELAALGARIRRCAEHRALTADQIAQAIVDALWDAFLERTPPALALVRLYRVRRVGDLPAELRALTGAATADAQALVLAASRGLEPAWNDPAASAAHRVLPLSDLDAIARAPMVAKLIGELGLPTPPPASDVLFVADAVGSPFVPAQRNFVLRYGVRSVIGCGGDLPGGGFAIIAFARIPVPAEVASGFASIGLHAGIALTYATDLAAPAEAALAARTAGLERLLKTAEFLFVKRATAAARETAELQQRSDDLARRLAEATDASVTRQERTQRAMLNVIEDLREARNQLEQRVAQRTLDLERTNGELRAINGELEQFAYVASHDLQEPLRTIAGYLQLLEERYGERLDADGHEFIAYAVRGAQRLQELIDALLAYSGIARTPIELGVIPLDRPLDDALHAMARTFHESQAHIERTPLPAVRGDPVLLRQLFQNLLSNAVKFAGATPPRIEIRAETTAVGVELAVRDHGLGFDPKYAEQIFKVFRRLQRKLPGTGIGLAICKKIVERHGGTIRAVSLPGCGATFYMTLPAPEPSQALS